MAGADRRDVTSRAEALGDDELVGRARRGDRAAFAVLFERHRTTAAALVGRLLEARQEVEDVLQESAVQALVGLDRLRDPGRFGPWLCGIALNVARRVVREQIRRARWPGAEPVPPPGTEELFEEAETASRVRRAVASLPAGQRQAVQLYYLESLRETEVALELGVARSAVKSRLHKARRSLKVQLRGEREVIVGDASLLEVEVSDVRREPSAAPGAWRTHVVLLRERGGEGRTLPIFVGEFEGVAMAVSLTGRQTPRPMTYQLAASLVGALSGQFIEVRVVRLSETTYVAEVVVEGGAARTVIDARPSDAINLALLTGAPIRVSNEVMDQWALTGGFSLEEFVEDAEVIGSELLGSLATHEQPDRLTPEGLGVFAAARREAASRSYPAVGTEHLLLALLRHDSNGPLVRLGMTVQAVEAALVARPSSGPASGEAPLTPQVVQVLRRAERRARSRPDTRATPDDLLAALLDEPGGMASRLINDMAIDRDTVRAELAR